MTSCTFCGSPIEAGTGKMYIKRDGTVLNFDRAKCQRNMVELGRINRHVRWTQAAEEHKSERVETHAGKAGQEAKAAAKAANKPASSKAKAPAKKAEPAKTA